MQRTGFDSFIEMLSDSGVYNYLLVGNKVYGTRLKWARRDLLEVEEYASRVKEGDPKAVSRFIESGQIHIDNAVMEVTSWTVFDFLRI
jgi:hypothetical protein